MKKALVVLLILAVAGGLFAQSVSFSGRLDGGLGWTSFDGNDDSQIGLVAKNLEGNGIRAELNGTVTSDNGTAGISTRIRAGAAGSSGFPGGINFRWAFGWVSFADDLLRVQGGRFQGNNFDTFCPISDGATLYDNYGLLAYINPTDIIQIGVGAFTGETVSEAANMEKVNLYLGLGVYMGIFDLRAQFNMMKDDANLLVSARTGAVQNLDIEATIDIRRLDDFSDSGTMTFMEHVGINMIENLGIHIASAQSISQADDSDLALRVWAWLTYNMGTIIPRIDVNFGTGAGVNFNGSGIGVNDRYKVYKYDSDLTYLTVTPSVKFQVANNRFVDLGYCLGVDMSSNDKAALGSKNGGVNHAAYIDVLVRF